MVDYRSHGRYQLDTNLNKKDHDVEHTILIIKKTKRNQKIKTYKN